MSFVYIVTDEYKLQINQPTPPDLQSKQAADRESGSRSHRWSVVLNRPGAQEDEQRAAGDGERATGGAAARSLLPVAPRCARSGHSRCAAVDEEKCDHVKSVMCGKQNCSCDINWT